MRLSLRYRLLLPLGLLLVGDGVATAWAASIAARNAERQLAEQQWAIANTLSEPRSTFPLTKPILEQMKGFSGAEFMFVPAGGTLREPESTFPEAHAPPDVRHFVPPILAKNMNLGPPVTIGGREYRCMRLWLTEQNPNRRGDLYIFYPESLRQTAVRDAVRPLLVLGGLGGLLAVALAIAFGARLVRRIRDLDARTRLIAAGDFRPMPVPAVNDELRDLNEAVNDMAHQLAAFQDESKRSERLRVLGQLSGGLAHQLRNSATGAKLAVELYLQENANTDPEPLRVALRQLSRIESNLRQFLDLGKPSADVKQQCNLVPLIDQAVSLMQAQAKHAGTALLWKAPGGPSVIVGDPTQLAHLVSNLIGNALEAAGPGGSVEVALTPRGRLAVVEVVDTGSGPPPELAAKLFEPFVTGKPEGIGLGLAVAKQAADAHGGRIEWERRDGRTTFRVTLPLLKQLSTGSQD
jgi:signal transduction histidine kinase